MKIEKIKLSGHPFLGNMEIDFTGPDGEALNTIVIAGINGSGKTTLLETIFQAVTNEDPKFPLKYELGLDFSNTPNTPLKKYDVSSFGEGLSQIEWLREEIQNIDIKDRPKVFYMPTEINFKGLQTTTLSFNSKYKFENIVDREAIEDVPSYIASYISGEVFKNQELPAKQAIDKVCGEINSLFDMLEIDAKLIGLKPEEKLLIFENSAGKTFDINHLSSGEKQLFVRALALKMLNANNSIILVDEPEISLHPQWQQRIMKVYEKVGKNNQVIAATHSPHIVASVKKESVKLLKRHKGKIEIAGYKDINGSYGLPVDIVLQELMELNTTRDPEVANEIRELWDMIHNGSFREPGFKERYDKVEAFLGSDDEELMLMRVEMAKLKAQRKKVNAKDKKG
ncbi:MAG: AAA family ATPase [Candidatus Aminicenantes bacterium]|nr:AAA family ATPase [Candidatus Aminicenantes bacterium]